MSESLLFGDKSAEDERYFKAYSEFCIHKEMVGDVSRTNAYRRAILGQYQMFYKKVVLDVGCGSGILSLFCAQAGAKKVYAVDASDMADVASKLVCANGMESKITVLKSRVEDIKIPEKVDVIVSEWMGYFLLQESMLQTVIYARERFLKPGGHIFPEKAVVYMATANRNGDHLVDTASNEESGRGLQGVSSTELHLRAFGNQDESIVNKDKVEFWSELSKRYDVNLSPLAQIDSNIPPEPVPVDVEKVLPQHLTSHGHKVLELDLNEISMEEAMLLVALRGSVSTPSLLPASPPPTKASPPPTKASSPLTKASSSVTGSPVILPHSRKRNHVGGFQDNEVEGVITSDQNRSQNGENLVKSETLPVTHSSPSLEVKGVPCAIDLTLFGDSPVDSLVAWFDVTFPGGKVVLSTSPHSEPTHWCQCVLGMHRIEGLEQDSRVTGVVGLSYGRENRKRILEAELKVNVGKVFVHEHYSLE